MQAKKIHVRAGVHYQSSLNRPAMMLAMRA
jgi:hypothetical protein